jgi:hypothetical protein
VKQPLAKLITGEYDTVKEWRRGGYFAAGNDLALKKRAKGGSLMSWDLRKALEILKPYPGQYLETEEPVECHAEYVIEGEIVPNVRVREDQHTGTGKAMPEFPGYTGAPALFL